MEFIGSIQIGCFRIYKNIKGKKILRTDYLNEDNIENICEEQIKEILENGIKIECDKIYSCIRKRVKIVDLALEKTRIYN